VAAGRARQDAGVALTSFDNEGLTFDVQDRGPVDGEPVVLLHGFPQRASSWDRTAPLLHAREVRTLAPDQRGYSPGARAAGVADYTLEHLSGDVLALLDAAGLASAHVVGHDWGAAVGWALTARAPERVRSLTAVSVPHPRAFLHALRSPDQLRRSWYIAAFQVPVLSELVAARLLEGWLVSSGQEPALAARDVAGLRAPGAATGALRWYRAAPLGGRGPGPVDVPTVLVWGDADSAVGRAAVEGSAAHVRGPYRLEVLEGLGHWLPEQAPDRVADLVLTQLSGA